MENGCEGKGMDEYGSLYDQLAIKSCLIFTVSASREVFLQDSIPFFELFFQFLLYLVSRLHALVKSHMLIRFIIFLS